MPYYDTSSSTGWAGNASDSTANDWWAYSNRAQRVRVDWGAHVVQVLQEYEAQKNNKYKNPDWEV